ncbi:hypothetical protein [Rhizosphaericola mali]|uniref:RXYLT1 C-terminal domain-containing protein n=1 Tax=Rhizosphaericola mali TaxID=2545455 RepID=A0A5P2G4W6_9BACT|nr:hypothetical protein [Rhizosphaericola mali]QES89189.1 hypothetical protein E0W69_011120 [Rhizosphaericola mali]
MKKQFSLIYQTKDGLQTTFENQYWNDWLLEKVEKEIVYDDRKCSVFKSDSLVVYSTNNFNISTQLKEYIFKLEQPVLVHLSNEGQNHKANYYKQALAVLRTASWNPTTAYDNVFTLPLGFQSGYLNTTNQYEQKRELIWCFAGAIKQNRKEMLDTLENLSPNWYFKSSEWGSSDMKSTEELIEIYKKSIFAPTPFGNINYECFRTMESLEWGCIPVTTAFLGIDAYKYVYGDHPFIVGEDWKDAVAKMAVLLADESALIRKQKEVWDWYRAFKKELQEDVLKIISGHSSKVTGKQFQYQKESRRDLKLRWRFFKHFTLNVYWKRILGKAKRSQN